VKGGKQRESIKTAPIDEHVAYEKHHINVGGTSAVIEKEYRMGYIALVLIVVMFGVIFLLGSKSGKTTGSESEQAKETEVKERFRIGAYVQGLPGQPDPEEVVSCAVIERDFVIVKGVIGAEIGRIARNSITDISLSKEGTTSYRLELNWDDSSEVQHKAFFCFDDKRTSENMANNALQTLKKWQLVEQDQVAACKA